MKCILEGQLQDIGVKTINGMSSDVILTGADIQVNGIDNTKIDAALSNKADKSTHELSTYTSLSQIGISVGTETMKAIAQAMPGNSALTISVGAANNAVADGTAYPVVNGVSQHYGMLTVDCSDVNRVKFLFFTSTTSMGMYVATYNRSQYGWSGWTPVAAATPPQEYSLTLVDGFSGRGYMRKNQFGEVHIDGTISRATAILSYTQFATLPEGYRPAHAIYSAAVFTDQDSAQKIGFVILNPDGKVILDTTGGGLTASTFRFFVDFYCSDQGVYNL